MASVETVPSEILSAIFRLTFDQPPPRLHTARLLAYHRTRIRVLVRFSLVCRKWRSIVLGDGTLWAALAVQTSRADCQESTATILERSKRAIVDVSIICDDNLDSPHETIFSEISKSFGRVKSLRFHTTTPGALCTLSMPALKLEALEIFTAEQPKELGPFFGGDLPALRSLALAGFSSWPLGPLPSLKDLCLILSPSNPTAKISSLIDVMSGSPNIERIKLGGFLSMENDSPPSSLAHLPNLQNFTMRDCDSAKVLSHMIIPATADIKIVADHRRMRAAMRIPSRHYHILLSVPVDISAAGFLKESTTFVLQQDQKIGFGIGFYRSRSSQPTLRVFDRSASIELFARRSIEVLARHPHYFANIKDLSLPLSASAAVPWSRLLRGFERLERLNVVALHAPSILTALMVTGQDDHRICPTLKQLDIHDKGDDAIALDEDEMKDFFMARIALSCAATEVTIRWSGGRKTWKCGASGWTVVRY